VGYDAGKQVKSRKFGPKPDVPDIVYASAWGFIEPG
jgi:hypothetical protein